jgi:hypothetical protein
MSPMYWGRPEGDLAQAYQLEAAFECQVDSAEWNGKVSEHYAHPRIQMGLSGHHYESDGGPDTSYRAGPSLLNHADPGRQSTFEHRFRPLETNFSESASKPILGLTSRSVQEGCCSARSGTAMDLGLDYCRVLLALGFVSS